MYSIIFLLVFNYFIVYLIYNRLFIFSKMGFFENIALHILKIGCFREYNLLFEHFYIFVQSSSSAFQIVRIFLFSNNFSFCFSIFTPFRNNRQILLFQFLLLTLFFFSSDSSFFLLYHQKDDVYMILLDAF